MRPFFILFFALAPSFVFSQNENTPHSVFLNDGSILHGKIIESAENEQVSLRLSSGRILRFEKSEVLRLRKSNRSLAIFDDGRRLVDHGVFSSISVQSLTGRSTSPTGEALRWGLGAHFTAGYRFFPALGLGGGIGIDANQYFFAPVFGEVSGFLVSKKFRSKYFGTGKNSTKPVRRFPFCYSLQVGWNLPIGDMHGDDDFQETKGGWMVYPAVGFLFPSRYGHTFRLDVGYKFQQFAQDYQLIWWIGRETRDKVTLRSFSVRAGWIF